MLNVVHTQGDGALARVFVAELTDGSRVECVESVQPPVPRDEKWVLIVSTLKGCPVRCSICDAGGSYGGRLTAEEILDQIQYMITERFGEGPVPVAKLKVQFARMGDPAFNPAVLTVLEVLADRVDLPGLMPCISTIAPRGCDRFFDQLLEIKQRRYPTGRFQMQFSLHTTCEQTRARLIPARTWSLAQMARYGDRFFAPGDRKITLNFAPARNVPLEPDRIAPLFSPERFIIKLTPINPTFAATRAGIEGLIDPADPAACRAVQRQFEASGYETIVSIGELAENQIGSNCGMFASATAAS